MHLDLPLLRGMARSARRPARPTDQAALAGGSRFAGHFTPHRGADQQLGEHARRKASRSSLASAISGPLSATSKGADIVEFAMEILDAVAHHGDLARRKVVDHAAVRQGRQQPAQPQFPQHEDSIRARDRQAGDDGHRALLFRFAGNCLDFLTAHAVDR